MKCSFPAPNASLPPSEPDEGTSLPGRSGASGDGFGSRTDLGPAVARACGARAPERCPDRLSAGRLRVVQARTKACPERRRRGGRRRGSAKSGGADTTKGTETSRSSIQPEQTDKQLRYTSHLSNFGCLASQSRFRKYELPSNGTSTLAPPLTCDSTNAKSSSLFALASRTPHRVSPPLSNA